MTLAAQIQEGGTVHRFEDNLSPMACAINELRSHMLDEQGFISVVTQIPIVRQNPLPSQPYWDTWTRVEGPLCELGRAFDRGDIPANVHDAALDAMIEAGHDA